jgi:hypothetical protein
MTVTAAELIYQTITTPWCEVPLYIACLNSSKVVAYICCPLLLLLLLLALLLLSLRLSTTCWNQIAI